MSAQGGGLGVRRRQTGVPLLRLEFLSGERAGQAVELPEGVHGLGSTRGARVQVPDPDVAREHATLTVAPGAARVDELRQGETSLNGARLSGWANLAEGDLLKLGRTELRVAFLTPPPPGEPEPGEPGEAAPAGRTAAARDEARVRREEQRAARDEARAARDEERATREAARRARPDLEPAGERRPYGNDQVALHLAQFFRRRPDMPFDFALLGKERVHGWYWGDGRPERKLGLGWRPLHVLFLMPHFPQLPPGGWPPSDRSGRLQEPGPHPQPELLADGFQVGPMFNRTGEHYSYVAFRDLPRRETAPLRMPPPASGRP